MNDLTFEDLRVHFGTGRAYTVSGKGRDRVLGYRSGKRCNLGDIEDSDWMKMVKDLIAHKGEQELHQQLLTHLKEHNCFGSTKAELESEALELHAARIFDNPLWVDFLPFNNRFRPEVMRTTKMVSVMPDCCKKVGLMTEARYQSNQKENYCPHCGRWTKISLADNKEKQEAQQ